jgi:DNA replication and repair protein RecF
MRLDHLWLTDFRNYREAEFSPAAEGITVVSGSNGEGKTNLIEAVGYLATLRSLRGSPAEALVRDGATNGTAIVRAEGQRDGRRVLIEAELRAVGRDRVQVNGQALRRTRDLNHVGACQVDNRLLVFGLGRYLRQGNVPRTCQIDWHGAVSRGLQRS